VHYKGIEIRVGVFYCQSHQLLLHWAINISRSVDLSVIGGNTSTIFFAGFFFCLISFF